LRGYKYNTLKVNNIQESIKTKGIQYGRPIIKLDIGEDGIDRNIEKIISLLNRDIYLCDYLLITGSCMSFKNELISLVRYLPYIVEIETDGTISPKGLSDLTHVNFCVILNTDKRRKFDETLKEYKVLSEYKRAHFLFNISSKYELNRVQKDQEKYNLSPIYISFNNDLKDKVSIIRNSNRNGWFVTPELSYKE